MIVLYSIVVSFGVRGEVGLGRPRPGGTGQRFLREREQGLWLPGHAQQRVPNSGSWCARSKGKAANGGRLWVLSQSFRCIRGLPGECTDEGGPPGGHRP